MQKPPYNTISTLRYVHAHTGELIEEIQMREFYVWDAKRNGYVMTRHYELSREAELNPTFNTGPDAMRFKPS